MSKTQKELAFLRDLYITNDWSERFTDIVDANFKLPKTGKFLYFNIGTGNHALAVRENLRRDVKFFGVSENKETLIIAQAKANAVEVNVKFESANGFSHKDFDTVLADAMLVRPQNLNDFLNEVARAATAKGLVTFVLPTAGSFGEIFSLLWEVLYNADLAEHGAEVERLITQIPTVSDVEETARRAGLENIDTLTKTEVFEYDTGEEFVKSPLATDFLLPVWLDFLSEKERKQVLKKLVQTIDAERDDITFRFSVKATLVTGEKAK